MFSFYLTGLKKLIDIGKKILLVVVVFVAIISLFSYFINKDKPQLTYDPIKKNREEIYKVINDPKLNKTKEGKLTIATYRMMLCGMIGEGCTDNPSDGDKNFNHSLFGFITNLIVLPYANPPASGIYWAYSGLTNAGFIPKTYAVGGLGFNSLHGFHTIWNAFRKLAYLIIVLVIITIGFMIMFRMKLNPQTVISIENALPKIIIALILITFSYPIVGFAIDLMYLIIVLGTDIIAKGLNISLPAENIINANVFSMTLGETGAGGIGGLIGWPGTIYGKALWGLYTLHLSIVIVIGLLLFFASITLGFWLVNQFQGFFGKILGHIGLSAGLQLDVGDIIASILSLIVGGIVGGLAIYFLILLFILISFLFLAFRIFFTLLSALINIILLTVLSPLVLLLEAIPGRSTFSSWLRSIIGNLLIFPVTVFLLLLAYGLSQIYSSPSAFTLPLLEGINSDGLMALIIVTFLFMVPDLAKAAKQTIVGKEGLEIPVVPGAMFAAGKSLLGGATSFGQQLYYFQVAKTSLIGGDGKGGGLLGGIKDLLTGAAKQSSQQS